MDIQDNSHIYSVSSKSPQYKTNRQSHYQANMAAELSGIKTIDRFDSSARLSDGTTILTTTTTQQIQRKFLKIFYIYAILLVSLYVTYAAYHYFQQKNLNQINDSQSQVDAQDNTRSSERLRAGREEAIFPSAEYSSLLLGDLESKLESKIHLLERYIEVIALDLQETKSKLKEREKCDCAISCTFNGTKYADQSSWNNQCDICTCQTGQISCAPRKCPVLKCDDAITLPGQCCPTCMRKCKHNNSLIRHGHKFNPNESNLIKSNQTKECTCYDGKIKCEIITQKQQIVPNELKIVRSKVEIDKQQPRRMQTLSAISSRAANQTTGQQKIHSPDSIVTKIIGT